MRTKPLLEVLKEAMAVVTPELVMAHYGHYLDALADVLQYKDL